MVKLKIEKTSLVTFLLICSIVTFLIDGNNAFDWPLTDNFNFFLRFFNPDYLLNDFFTNSTSSDANPRWVFQYVIALLSIFLNLDWFKLLYIIKCLIVVFQPILLFNYISSLSIRFNSSKKQTIQILVFFFLFLLITFNNILPRLISIGWWVPNMVQPNPQVISFFLLLIFLINDLFNKNSFLNHFLLFFSILIHPTVGIIGIILFLLQNIAFSFKKEKYKYVYTILISYIIHVFLFGQEDFVSTERFLDIYVFENHPSHYDVKNLGYFFIKSDFLLPILISILYVIPIIYFSKKNKNVFYFGTLSFLSFLTSILFQYIFVYVYPTKLMISLGIIRFTFVNYYLLTVLWSNFISEFISKDFFNVLVLSKNNRITIIIISVFFLFTFMKKVSLYDTLGDEDIKMIKFIQHNTKSTDIFGTNYGIKYVDLIAQRPVFTGNGFPFNEKYFEEHQRRRELLYGQHKNAPVGQTAEYLFNFKTSKELFEISKKDKLDYVIIRQEYSGGFEQFNPLFSNKNVIIFKVSDFEKP